MKVPKYHTLNVFEANALLRKATNTTKKGAIKSSCIVLVRGTCPDRFSVCPDCRTCKLASEDHQTLVDHARRFCFFPADMSRVAVPSWRGGIYTEVRHALQLTYLKVEHFGENAEGEIVYQFGA